MGKFIRVLVLEDSAVEAELNIRELRRGGFDPEWKRVDSEADYLIELDSPYDLVLADYSLPSFDGLRAVMLLRARGLDIPFILISGTLGEEKAVEAMKQGATDYLLKDRITRLGASVDRALTERQNRLERAQAIKNVQASENRYRRLFEAAKDGILILDARSGQIEDVNPYLTKLLDYSHAEFVGRQLWEFGLFGDAAANQTALRKLQRDGFIRYDNLPLRARGGREIWVEFVNNCYDANGRSVIQCNIRDITERKLAESRVQQLNRVYAVLSGINETIVRVKNQGAMLTSACLIAVERGFFRMAWIGLFDKQGNKLEVVSHAGGTPEILELLKSFLASEGCKMTSEALHSGEDAVCNDVEHDPRASEWRALGLKHGYHAMAALPLKDNQTIIGTFNLYAGEKGFFNDDELRLLHELAMDIGFALEVNRRESVRVRAENALKASESQYRTLFEYAPDGIVISDPQSRYVDANSSACKMLGYSDSELVGMTIKDIVAPSDVARIAPALTDIRARRACQQEWQLLRKNGSRFAAEVIATAMPDGNILAMIRDISERRQAERALRDSEARYREMLEKLKLIAVTLDTQGHVTFCNDYLLHLTGWHRDEVMGSDWFAKFVPDSNDGIRELFLHGLEVGEVPQHNENAIRTRIGERREIVWNNTALRDTTGKVRGSASIGIDVTERTQAEQALRESEERFRQLAENIDEVFWIVSPGHGQILYVSPAYEKIWGRAPAELYRSRQIWLDTVHPDDREQVRRAMTNPESGEYDETYRILRPDGSLRWIHDRAFPLRNEAGNVFRVVGIAADITANRNLEEQFRQSQKMEAFGLLAGGIAHDFNNLLSVVVGYCDLWLMRLPEDAPVRAPLRTIRSAGDRAAALTKQLLAFSRQTVLEPKVLNLNTVVHEIEKMLERLIGENINLVSILDPNIPRIKVDPGQIGQVLINLAVNARDAMPHGGTLTIQTASTVFDDAYVRANPGAQKGRAVILSVSDTGHGMTPEIMAHIFEPFFTTKEIGKGTGLGLAVVHGVVTQSGGTIQIQSNLECGTQFKLFFPATQEGLSQMRKPEVIDLHSGKELIFVVEDESSLRSLIAESLQSYGYSVLTAATGNEALERIKHSESRIDLVLTDVVMPGMSGRELADALKQSGNPVKVLFMSGYTDDSVLRHGVDWEEMAFLQKPFTPFELLRKIRQVLDTLGLKV